VNENDRQVGKKGDVNYEEKKMKELGWKHAQGKSLPIQKQ
jgi:hypothetical protein